MDMKALRQYHRGYSYDSDEESEKLYHAVRKENHDKIKKLLKEKRCSYGGIEYAKRTAYRYKSLDTIKCMSGWVGEDDAKLIMQNESAIKSISVLTGISEACLESDLVDANDQDKLIIKELGVKSSKNVFNKVLN